MTENTQREMTLREWVERLPASHLARREYDALTTPPAAQVQQEADWPMTDAQVRQWIAACNHEPARQVLRDYLQLRATHPAADALGAVRSLIGEFKTLAVVDNDGTYLIAAEKLQTALAQAPAIRGAGLSDPMALRMALDEARNILGPEKFEGIAIMFREQDALIDSLQEALAQAPAVRVTEDDAFYAGWKMAAQWADRQDLLADVGSPAYQKGRDAALGQGKANG